MEDFAGKVAVVTGGGTGMGRELVRQLAAVGCHVGLCDVDADAMAETVEQATVGAPAGVRFSTTVADVSDEAQVLAFRDAVAGELSTDVVHLLFNNAGIGGGSSMVTTPRDEWERTFAVDWYGVYYGVRAFLPLLLAADAGHVINTSSVNGFYAALGPVGAHTSYSAAKFAVKGFTEALITDFRVHAPHLQAHLVMPGHIGTSIVRNTAKVLSAGADGDGGDVSDRAMETLKGLGMPVDGATPEQVAGFMDLVSDGFRDLAPTTAADAATIILDGVRSGRWRILVGADAEALDAAVRIDPETAYEPEMWASLQADGHFGGGRGG